MQAGRIALGALAAIGALVLVFLWTRPGARESAPPVAPAERSEPEPDRPRPSLVPVEPRADARSAEAREEPGPAPATTAPAEPEPAPPATPGRATVRGHVVDPSGALLAGVRVRFEGAEGGGSSTTSALDGAFALEVERPEGRIMAADERYATVRASRVRPSGLGVDQLVVAAPAIDLAGRVIDEAGAGVAGARVAFDLSNAALRGLPFPLDTTESFAHATHAGRDGAFELRAVPAARGATLSASMRGFESAREPMPLEGRGYLVLALRAESEQADSRLTGIVLHADGSAAEGARVHLGGASAETDAAGRFRLAPERWIEEEQSLVATKRGHQPAVLLEFGRVVRASEGAPPPVSLVLGGPTLRIAGRVVAHDGSPRPGWTVEVADPTEITRDRVPAVVAESLSARSGGGVRTNESGAFEIDGLSDRRYTLRAWDPESFVTVLSDPISAGTEDVVLRVPAGALVEPLRGRVVSPRGDPLGGVSVSVRFETARSGGARAYVHGGEALTDAEGRFELPRVPRAGVSLALGGETVVPDELPVDELDLDAEPTLVVRRRCHFRVLATPEADGGPDAFLLEREDGRAEPLHVFRATSSGSSTLEQLDVGESEVLSAGEGSYALVLRRAGAELSRRAVELAPGDVQVLDAR